MHLSLKLLLNFKASSNVQQTYPLISLEAMKGKLWIRLSLVNFEREHNFKLSLCLQISFKAFPSIGKNYKNKLNLNLKTKS